MSVKSPKCINWADNLPGYNERPTDHVGEPRISNPGHKLFVSDSTLAELLDTSRSTIWRYVRNGTFPQPVKIGGLTRFDRKHVMACVKAGEIVPKTATLMSGEE